MHLSKCICGMMAVAVLWATMGSGSSDLHYVKPLSQKWGNLDATTSSGVADNFILRQVFRTLVRMNPNSEITGDLAAEWAVRDAGKRIYFRIKRGISFHDGSPLRLEDIKATFNRLRQTESYKSAYYSRISDITIDHSDNSIIFEQAGIDSRFMWMFTGATASISKMGESTSQLNGTGAYRVIKRTSEELVLTRNEGFNAPKSAVKILTIKHMSKDAALSAYHKGEVDDLFDYTIALKEYQSLRERCSWQFIKLPAFTFLAIKGTGHRALLSPTVRRCLFELIDRKSLAAAWSPNQTAMPGFVPDGIQGGGDLTALTAIVPGSCSTILTNLKNALTDEPLALAVSEHQAVPYQALFEQLARQGYRAKKLVGANSDDFDRLLRLQATHGYIIRFNPGHFSLERLLEIFYNPKGDLPLGLDQQPYREYLRKIQSGMNDVGRLHEARALVLQLQRESILLPIVQDEIWGCSKPQWDQSGFARAPSRSYHYISEVTAKARP